MKWVTEDEFIAVLNERLQAHPDYRLGMRFVHYPPGSSGKQASGYDWEPKVDPYNPHPFASVSAAVRKEYCVLG